MPHLFYGRTVPGTLVIGSWLVLIAYWFVSAFFAKPSVRGERRRFVTAFRVQLVIAAFALFQLLWARTNRRWQPDFASFWSWIGAALTLAGMAIAVPQTLRKDHELVTNGPYHLVRHSIYTGIVLALFGTALAYGPFWFIMLFGVGAFFVYSTYVEERDLCARFPDTYRAYRRARTAWCRLFGSRDAATWIDKRNMTTLLYRANQARAWVVVRSNFSYAVYCNPGAGVEPRPAARPHHLGLPDKAQIGGERVDMALR
jgi:protein-S-isoprenylcysteine O-methyltransferase Ste14